MSRPEPTTLAEMHERYLDSRARLGLDDPSPRARLAPRLRPEPAPIPDRDLRPAEIEALADTLLRRMAADDGEALGLPRPILLADVLRAVARHYGMTPDELRSERRTAPVVHARQKAMWLARRLTLRSMPAIGRAFGGRDHTTVLHSLTRIEAERAADPDLRAELDEIEAALRRRFEAKSFSSDPNGPEAP